MLFVYWDASKSSTAKREQVSPSSPNSQKQMEITPSNNINVFWATHSTPVTVSQPLDNPIKFTEWLCARTEQKKGRENRKKSPRSLRQRDTRWCRIQLLRITGLSAGQSYTTRHHELGVCSIIPVGLLPQQPHGNITGRAVSQNRLLINISSKVWWQTGWNGFELSFAVLRSVLFWPIIALKGGDHWARNWKRKLGQHWSTGKKFLNRHRANSREWVLFGRTSPWRYRKQGLAPPFGVTSGITSITLWALCRSSQKFSFSKVGLLIPRLQVGRRNEWSSSFL